LGLALLESGFHHLTPSTEDDFLWKIMKQKLLHSSIDLRQ
jgi:hypothetical protein